MQDKVPPEWAELLAILPFDSIGTAEEDHFFDPEIASRYIGFIEDVCVFVEGERAGEPFRLEPWQASYVACLFGWRRVDGRRRFTQSLLLIPRKSGKTSLLASILLAVAFLDNEPGAQLYSIAADREQASLVYRIAAQMIEREPLLSARAKVYRSFKSIELPNGSIYKALSADAGTKHGLSAHVILADEIHSMPNAELLETLQTSQGARREPLLLMATTQDFDRPSLCNTKRDYAAKVRDKEIADASFLPVLYEAQPDEDWTSEEVWKRCNPNLGVSNSIEFLRRECQRAKQERAYEATFRRLFLNQRTSTHTVWVKLHDWDACQREPIDLTGRECYGGLDLSTTTDLSCLCLAFPGDEVWLRPFYWIPERKLRDKRDRVPYELWAKQGLVTVTDGDAVDYDRILADIVALGQRYGIQELRVDPWNATQLATALAEKHGFRVTQVRQGFQSLSAPSKELERAVLARSLAHDGNPVLRWNIGNTMVRQDENGNLRPDKARSTDRIDGTVATILALSGVMADEGPSVYEGRGLVTL